MTQFIAFLRGINVGCNNIIRMIEKELESIFKYRAKVLIRSKDEMKNTVTHFPEIFKNIDWKHNIIFLRESLDSKNILKKFEIKKEIEELNYYQGVLFWSAKMDTITKSVMLKLSTRKEYQEMTVRNINTTRKILELMNIA